LKCKVKILNKKAQLNLSSGSKNEDSSDAQKITESSDEEMEFEEPRPLN
jgi:hypothetical protein